MDRSAILSVRDLSLDFGTPRGRVHALRSVNVDVQKERIIGIVGESGCGKSTLASSLINLLAANAEIVSGRIDFDGRDVLRLGPDELRRIRGQRIAMIFQDPMTALNPVTTIGQQMIEVQYREHIQLREKRRRAIALLDRVGIPDAAGRLDAYPHHFSGGMRQRICIAMALLMRPDVLVADEPTTALDATLEVQIINLLKELQRDLGCSIVFVSHHLGTVAELCDEVVVMYAGEVVEKGPVRDIFHNPAHPYTRALFECDPGRIKVKTRHLPTIPGELPDLRDVPEGCIFRGRCPRAHARCADVAPRPSVLGNGHVASCHLLNEVAVE